MNHFDNFISWVSSLPDHLIYLVLALSAFIENLFPPIPGDTILVFGAFLAGTGRLSFAGLYISTTLGSLAGFMVLYQVGILLGRRFFIEGDFWIFKARNIVRAEEWFQCYGYYLIIANRFIPGLRSAISLTAGIAGLRPLYVAVLAAISAAVWNLIWIGMGFMAGNSWEAVRRELEVLMVHYKMALLICLVLLAAGCLLRRWLRRRS